MQKNEGKVLNVNENVKGKALKGKKKEQIKGKLKRESIYFNGKKREKVDEKVLRGRKRKENKGKLNGESTECN